MHLQTSNFTTHIHASYPSDYGPTFDYIFFRNSASTSPSSSQESSPPTSQRFHTSQTYTSAPLKTRSTKLKKEPKSKAMNPFHSWRKPAVFREEITDDGRVIVDSRVRMEKRSLRDNIKDVLKRRGWRLGDKKLISWKGKTGFAAWALKWEFA